MTITASHHRIIATEPHPIVAEAVAIAQANRATFDLSTYAGREQFVWVMQRIAEKHRHEAYVERSLITCDHAVRQAHETAARYLTAEAGRVG